MPSKRRKREIFYEKKMASNHICVDFELATTWIANRHKPILQNTVSQTQNGFLRGGYIGQCVL